MSAFLPLLIMGRCIAGEASFKMCESQFKLMFESIGYVTLGLHCLSDSLINTCASNNTIRSIKGTHAQASKLARSIQNLRSIGDVSLSVKEMEKEARKLSQIVDDEYRKYQRSLGNGYFNAHEFNNKNKGRIQKIYEKNHQLSTKIVALKNALKDVSKSKIILGRGLLVGESLLRFLGSRIFLAATLIAPRSVASSTMSDHYSTLDGINDFLELNNPSLQCRFLMNGLGQDYVQIAKSVESTLDRLKPLMLHTQCSKDQQLIVFQAHDGRRMMLNIADQDSDSNTATTVTPNSCYTVYPIPAWWHENRFKKMSSQDIYELKKRPGFYLDSKEKRAIISGKPPKGCEKHAAKKVYSQSISNDYRNLVLISTKMAIAQAQNHCRPSRSLSSTPLSTPITGQQ